jgi:hypothetical protein
VGAGLGEEVDLNAWYVCTSSTKIHKVLVGEVDMSQLIRNPLAIHIRGILSAPFHTCR